MTDQSVARVPSVGDPPADAAAAGMFAAIRARGGHILNLHLVMAHAPALADASRALAYAIRFDAVTPRRERELAIMRAAQILDGEYELNQHRPMALACGITQAQIDAMPAWRGSSLFADKERALIAYVEQVVPNGKVDDATFAALAGFFSTREIVELTMTIAAYASTAMFTNALRIKVEDDGRSAVRG